jgi:hypothetical protein
MSADTCLRFGYRYSFLPLDFPGNFYFFGKYSIKTAQNQHFR